MVFCYLNAACAFLIAYFFKIGMSSMAIVAAERKWRSREKVLACRNAGVMYTVLAVLLTVRSFVLDRREAQLARQSFEERMAEYQSLGMHPAAERQPLLDRPTSGYGSTDSSNL